MKTEYHIWVGLQPQVYLRFNIMPARRPAFKFPPEFKSANDREGGFVAPDGEPLTGPLESTKPKLTVIVDFPLK